MARRTPESRHLTTTIEVLKVLGDIRVVAALTGTDWKNVDNWQRATTFPSRYFWVMWLALFQRGYSAPPELWGQVVPAQRRQALKMMVAAARKQKAA